MSLTYLKWISQWLKGWLLWRDFDQIAPHRLASSFSSKGTRRAYSSTGTGTKTFLAVQYWLLISWSRTYELKHRLRIWSTHSWRMCVGKCWIDSPGSNAEFVSTNLNWQYFLNQERWLKRKIATSYCVANCLRTDAPSVMVVVACRGNQCALRFSS